MALVACAHLSHGLVLLRLPGCGVGSLVGLGHGSCDGSRSVQVLS
ncbi:hypothetical protein EV14_0589 [Prochlorococcus sp. MIT 0703]|nr:hypothetical protein EV12_1915 [Prochlorococcus sp. MIT 0701]KGG36180.1 hypothetical protein EV14_0589 [Prochlorococcus sp. MIT 0703]